MGGKSPRVFRYGPHFGEEPPVSGTRGSGTVFFSHCTLRCIYCQNFPWSQEHRGEEMSVDRLRAMGLRHTDNETLRQRWRAETAGMLSALKLA